MKLTVNKIINQNGLIINTKTTKEEKYKIKIINLKEREDRKMHMINELTKNDITNYEFVEAVNGKKLKELLCIKKLFERNDFNYKKGVIGCALSHIFLWNELVNDEKSEFYVILEDDINLCEHFKTHINRVCQLFLEQDLEHLALGEYNTQKEMIKIGYEIKIYKKDLYKEGHITFAYIISKKAALKALQNINCCSLKPAIDHPEAVGYILNYYSLNYPLVSCNMMNEYGSDIQIQREEWQHEKKIRTELKISFCDWWYIEYCGGNFDVQNNFLTNLLREHGNNYEIKLVSPNENPDILFYSIFGNTHKSYIAGRKIFFSGEPYGKREDADYNITFDKTSNTNARIPLWLCYLNNELLEESRKRTCGLNIIPKKEHFCSFIASGPGIENNRKYFIDKLMQYKKVDCGGAYLNNIGFVVPRGIESSGKIEHNRKYKFALAFESTIYPGYVSEKICDIFKSNTIPIYWGTRDVVEDFNSKSFINANDFHNFDDLVNYIIKVDNDDELYKSYFKESIFTEKWNNIFLDPNKTFFKNVADIIIGNNKNLLQDILNNKDQIYEK